MSRAKKSVLEVFDLDHTLISVNGSYRFGRFLFKKGFLSFFDVVFCLFIYSGHKLFGLSLNKLHNFIFRRIFYGKDFDVINNYVYEFVSENFDAFLCSPVVDFLEEAKKQSHYVVILSNSPDFLVRAFAERFKVDCWKGSAYDVDKLNKFSKVSNVFDGEQKRLYVKKLMKKLGVDRFNLKVYTDNELDMPMLEEAGIPILVNPTRKLLSIGKERGWKVIK